MIVKENPVPDSLLILNQTANYWFRRLNGWFCSRVLVQEEILKIGAPGEPWPVTP